MEVEETQEREERAGWSSRQDCCCRVQGTTGTFAPVSADYRVQLNVERESLFPRWEVQYSSAKTRSLIFSLSQIGLPKVSAGLSR